VVEAIVGISLVLLSSIPDAIKDTVQFYFYRSVFNTSKLDSYWWNYNISWQNKYKNLDPSQGPRFFGSTTFLVWVTDAWHCFKAMHVLMICVGAFLIGYASIDIWLKLILAISSLTMSKVIFENLISKALKK
jgi:hypothetical protein